MHIFLYIFCTFYQFFWKAICTFTRIIDIRNLLCLKKYERNDNIVVEVYTRRQFIMTQFFWGNSSSSMQTEGGWNEGGKSLSVYDIVEPAEHRSDWHFANDNYHSFDEDLDLMKILI